MAPVIAAVVIARRGGVSTATIRPLSCVQVLGYLLVFLLVLRRLEEPSHMRGARRIGAADFLRDLRQVRGRRSQLKRWIGVAILTSVPAAMTTPFIQLHAHEYRSADAAVLAAMATVTILARLVFRVPLGRVADRLGRKRLIYLLTRLWYASFIPLVLARRPYLLVTDAALQSFCGMACGAAGAMGMELAPPELAGRWHGLLGVLGGLVAIPAPVLGGIIYRHWGPAWVFLLPISVDLAGRIPIPATVPETRHREPRRGSDRA